MSPKGHYLPCDMLSTARPRIALPFFMLWEVNALCLPSTTRKGALVTQQACGNLQLAVHCALALCQMIFRLLCQFSK